VKLSRRLWRPFIKFEIWIINDFTSGDMLCRSRWQRWALLRLLGVALAVMKFRLEWGMWRYENFSYGVIK
jgi:hypothetical protein